MATAKAEENKLTDMKLEVVVVPVSDVDRAGGSRKRGAYQKALRFPSSGHQFS